MPENEGRGGVVTNDCRLFLLFAVVGFLLLTTGCGSGYASCSPAVVTVSPDVLRPNGTAVVGSKGYPCHNRPVSGRETAILYVVDADNQDEAVVGSGLVAKDGSFEFVIHIPDRLPNLPLISVGQKAYIIAEGPTLPPCPRNAKCPRYETQVMVAPP